MNIKKRKSLNDSLAEQFLYPDNQSEDEDEDNLEQETQQAQIPTTSEPIPQAEPIPQSKSNLLAQLQQVTPKEPTVRLTVDLAESVHRKLGIFAAKTGKKKAEIIRFLVNEALKDLPDL